MSTSKSKAKIFYHDIGDYLSREEKLKKVKDFNSVSNVPWQQLTPNEKHDWINQRDGVFDSLILIGDKDDKTNDRTFFYPVYSCGLKTQRDTWCYNSSKQYLSDNIEKSIAFYNKQRELLIQGKIDSVQYDSTKFSWTRATLNDVEKNREYNFKDGNLVNGIYRPFFKQHLFLYRPLNEMMYQIPKLFPTPSHKNLVICVSGVGVTKDFSCIITDTLPDLELIGKSQCFPLYWYEENKKENTQMMLFGDDSTEKYIRHDGITDWILKEIRTRYGGAKNITKEMIFYYVYGLLHSPAYRERFSADLKKSLPRIPIVENVNEFMGFYKAGKQLAELHLNYETVPAYSGAEVEKVAKTEYGDDYEFYKVEQMRFPKKDEKGTIIYNKNITIRNIPEKAYRYIVNGKSAIEWIMERYAVKIDKDSLIKNDPNDWAREHQKPRYILDLLLSVINVSVQTVDIVEKLPKIEF
ncbi:hypothetical protein J5690_02940 [bacterium]|nr:hypothetical protein [bacterium]